MMFSVCASMKWAHLPNAGGLYDQDPGLLRKFTYIFGEQGKHEKAKADKAERERRESQRGGKGLGRPSSRSY